MNTQQNADPLEKLAATYDRPSTSAGTTENTKRRDWKPPAPPRDAEAALARTYSADPANPEGRGGDDEQRPAPDATGGDTTDGGEQPAEQSTDDASRGDAGSLQAPEGFAPLDADTARSLANVADELSLSPSKMQALVDKVSPVLQQRTERALNQLMTTWAEETTNDPEIGGEKLNATVAQARKALDTFGSPALRKLLGPPSKGGTGLGNNAAMVRFLAAVGRKLG